MTKKKTGKGRSTKAVKSLPAKTLSAKHARGVRGGRKSKGGQQYMKFTMKETLITG